MAATLFSASFTTSRQNAARAFSTTSSPRASILFQLGALSNSRETQHLNKISKLQRTDRTTTAECTRNACRAQSSIHDDDSVQASKCRSCLELAGTGCRQSPAGRHTTAEDTNDETGRAGSEAGGTNVSFACRACGSFGKREAEDAGGDAISWLSDLVVCGYSNGSGNVDILAGRAGKRQW
ncbi:hypothetical protein BST61_g10257 [Cercospora zeina]